MSRFAWLCVWSGLLFLSVQQAYAALSPEAQEHREETTVLENGVLQGKHIYSITAEKSGKAKIYTVEADCTYRFLIEYPMEWRVYFGWVGPQKFNVELMGEPDCSPIVNMPVEKNIFHQVIFSSVAKIYSMPPEQIKKSTSLYKVSTGPKKLGMDFRIIALRGYLDERVGCRIQDRIFMKIRTVADLLKAADAECNNP